MTALLVAASLCVHPLPEAQTYYVSKRVKAFRKHTPCPGGKGKRCRGYVVAPIDKCETKFEWRKLA